MSKTQQLMADAASNLDGARGQQPAELTAAVGSYASAQALLAVANEQRLSNMIAWYHVIPESDRGRKLREQIEQELGL